MQPSPRDLSGPRRPSPELYNTNVLPLKLLVVYAYEWGSVSQLSRAMLSARRQLGRFRQPSSAPEASFRVVTM